MLSLGVNLIVPIKTKKSPRATERATTVTVLGDAMESPRRVPNNPLLCAPCVSNALAVNTEKERGKLRRQQATRMTKGEEGAREKN